MSTTSRTLTRMTSQSLMWILLSLLILPATAMRFYSGGNSTCLELIDSNPQEHKGNISVAQGLLRNPTFQVAHPSLPFIYSVNEVDAYKEYKGQGAVASLRVLSDGSLELVNAVASGGSGPTHLGLHPSGRFLAVANYNGGSVSVFAINPDGSIGNATGFFQSSGSGPNKDRQEGPHCHQAVFDASGQYLFVPDLGSDRVLQFTVDADGVITPNGHANATSPGAGPRHLVFHPSAPWVFVVNELNNSVATYRFEQGQLFPQSAVSSLPAEFTNHSQAGAITLSHDGRMLYVTNRGHDSVAMFAVDAATGSLSIQGWVPSGGHWPRYASLVNDHTLLVANQESNVVQFFTVAADGGLRESTQVTTLTAPFGLVLVPKTRSPPS